MAGAARRSAGGVRRPRRGAAFAEDYYEIRVDRSTVEHIVARIPLTDAMVRALNPEATLADVRADVAAIGYPLAAR